MKKSFKGFGFYLVVPMILLLVFTLSRLQAAALKDTYEYGNFLNDLKAGNVKAVVISQNEETLTVEYRIKIYIVINVVVRILEFQPSILSSACR